MNEIVLKLIEFGSMVLGSALGGAITGGLIGGFCKGKIQKHINTVNVQEIEKNAVEKGIEKVKTISFKQSIQPIVESELVKINEKADEHIEKSLQPIEDKLDKIIHIQELQASYFDDSIGVPEKKKEELKSAIEEAKSESNKIETQDIIIENTISVLPNGEIEQSNEKTNKVSR